MSIGTIEELRKRVGLEDGDVSRDADLELAEATALDMVEQYLDRKLTYADDIETFQRGTKEFLVHRWPIDPDIELVIQFQSSPLMDYVTLTPNSVDYEKGMILFCGYVGAPAVTVSYTGGFETFPPALQWALWATFDAVWAGTPGFGPDPGAPVAGSTGAVKKVTLVGIGSVDMDTGSSSSGGSEGGGGSVEAWGLIPATAITFLMPYRRESVIGVG